ncbi:hypothetical protein ACQY0O_003423 [Thecaphora frezii]
MSPPSLQNQHPAAASALSAALAPAIALGLPRHSHNPFAIKSLRQDAHPASPTPSPTQSSFAPHPDAIPAKKSTRTRLRDRASRSISPFRLRKPRTSKRTATNNSNYHHHDNHNAPDSDAESVASSSASGITPRNNAFNLDDPDDDASAPSAPSSPLPTSHHPIHAPDHPNHHHHYARQAADDDNDSELDLDPEVLDNTLFNAGCLDLHDDWLQHSSATSRGASQPHPPHDTYIDENLEHDDEHIMAPNVVLAEQQLGPHVLRRGSKVMPLQIARPVFERNRCTISLLHGDYELAAKQSKRPKRYIVASDGSEESSYAIEWTIGTVLRDGDETLVVSVMETDTKLDALDPAQESHAARMEHQRTRQAMASVLARQATHLLERTRLEVKISCQAIHAKNLRHMLLDLIDFYTPTMVIVGSRGLGSLRGILLGSTSHYLVQKSSAPVMVARKRLKLPALPRGKSDVVQSVRMRHMRLDQAAVEKKSNVGEESPIKEKPVVPNADKGEGEGTDGADAQEEDEDEDEEDEDENEEDEDENENEDEDEEDEEEQEAAMEGARVRVRARAATADREKGGAAPSASAGASAGGGGDAGPSTASASEEAKPPSALEPAATAQPSAPAPAAAGGATPPAQQLETLSLDASAGDGGANPPTHDGQGDQVERGRKPQRHA